MPTKPEVPRKANHENGSENLLGSYRLLSFTSSVSAVVLIAIYISIGIVSYFRNKRALAFDKGITE